MVLDSFDEKEGGFVMLCMSHQEFGDLTRILTELGDKREQIGDDGWSAYFMAYDLRNMKEKMEEAGNGN